MGERFAPLSGVTVLDLTYYASGPIGAMALADLGADVIKIEPPGGEAGRRLGVTFPAGWSTFFLSMNRNKRSLCVDFRQSEGAQLLREIAAKVDIVLQNSRPGAWQRYGLDYQSLREVHPGIIYGSVSGFGETGPMSNWLAMDPIAQASGGIMAITGSPESGPVKVGAAIADVQAGRNIAFGLLAALIQRDRTGEGCEVTTSLFDTVVANLSMREVEFQFTGTNPELYGTGHGQIVPGQAFRTKDDKLVVFTAYTNEHFRLWCDLVNRPDLAEDPRFATNADRRANSEACIALVADVIAQYTADELTALLAGNLPYGPVLQFSDLFSHPQLAENKTMAQFEQPGLGNVRAVGSPVHFDARGTEVRHPCPELGEHTIELLNQFDISPERIAGLLRKGVVQVHAQTDA
jgi:crotonobetainyl-CoA:carnitine CoA-transferase CaiB-like acyl-CoA transferase